VVEANDTKNGSKMSLTELSVTVCPCIWPCP